MRRIVRLAAVSLDGYFEGPGRNIDWHLVDDEMHAEFNEVLGAMSAFLNGRVNHELMASVWPTADRDPDMTPQMLEFARIWVDMPKFVFSRTGGARTGTPRWCGTWTPRRSAGCRPSPAGTWSSPGPIWPTPSGGWT